jgi:DNA polymerase III epsilon subunit-like protein
MFISLDLETTGFEPVKDKIIEFGAVKFDLNGQKETLQFLVNPGITLPQIITHITGIKDKDLESAPQFQDKKQEILDFIQDFPIIGHNIQFDTNFLRENNLEFQNPEYDTCQLASILLPGLPSYSLEILSSALDLQHEEKHRALDDSIAAMELFFKLTEIFQTLPKELITKIHSLCEKTDWPLKNFLLKLSPSNKTAKFTARDQADNNKEKSQTPNHSQILNKILETSTSSLFETSRPYNNLISDLSKKINPDSYIAIPNQIFKQIIDDLPENIAKIDTPQQYISLKRLKQFEQKQFFTSSEFTAMLKYIIWTNQTETGHLSEITLFNKEKNTIPQINIHENIVNPSEEDFFIKALDRDKSSPAICSHQYLIENPLKIKTLYLFDIDKFLRSLYFSNSNYLKLDILLNQLQALKEFAPQNKTIESLSSKCTILFGLIGLIFEKYNDNNQFAPRVIFSQDILGTSYFKEARSAISNIIELSKELGEINNEKTNGHLQIWKNSLKILQNLFLNTNFEAFMIWLEQDFTQDLVIKSAPYSLEKPIQQILENCETYKIISENIDLNDEGTFTKTLLGLHQKIPFHNLTKKREDLDITILKDLKDEKSSTINFLKSLLTKKPCSTAIIFNSKKQLQYFTLELSPHFNKSDIKIVSQMTGSLGKLKEQFKQDPASSILFITPNFWDNFGLHEFINTLIIHKIPFDPPSDPYIITTSKSFEDPFNEFQIPRAIFSLKKMINALPYEPKNPKQVFILDPRLATKNYGKPLTENLKTLAETTICESRNLNLNLSSHLAHN